jgi:hypothetical protein
MGLPSNSSLTQESSEVVGFGGGEEETEMVVGGR